MHVVGHLASGRSDPSFCEGCYPDKMAAFQRVYGDDYFTVDFDASLGVVRFVRSAQPIASRDDGERTLVMLSLALSSFDLGRLGLLVDMRVAPLQSDDMADAELAARRRRLMGRFLRTAVLVQSAVKKLQMARIGRSQGQSVPLFDSEQDALAYLATSA